MSIEIVNDKDVVFIIRNMLNMIDTRLVAHGERVTFFVMKMMEEMNFTQEEIMRGCLLSLFHDIGAFKTDEIDDMLSFEKEDVLHHAVYGYLFLRTLTPLKDYADCILYHHISYQRLSAISCSWKEFTALLHLCDRIDTLLREKDPIMNVDVLMAVPGRFQQKHIDVFLRLDEEKHLCDAVLNDTYKSDIYALFPRIKFSDEEKHQYLRMVAYSIDFNSEFTVMHTILTTSLSLELGKQYHFNEDMLTRLYYGTLLHDVGKCSIPISILEKPGKLTQEEMSIMRTHVKASEVVLKGCLPEDILQIAIRHHEKLDGSGYPYGLNKDTLSLSERIVAVADIISALLGKRSYKDAFDIQKTIDILTTMAEQGKIDADIVHTFIDQYDTILRNVYTRSKPIEAMYEDMQQEYIRITTQLQANDFNI